MATEDQIAQEDLQTPRICRVIMWKFPKAMLLTSRTGPCRELEDDFSFILQHLLFPRQISPLYYEDSSKKRVVSFFDTVIPIVCNNLHELIPESPRSLLLSLFARWNKLDASNFDKVQGALEQLIEPGDYLPLYCAENNALISLRVPLDLDRKGKILVGSTQVLLSHRFHYEPDPAHLYPVRNLPDGPTFAVPETKLIRRPVIEKIVQFSRHPVRDKMDCDSNQEDQSTEVATHCYVTNWLMGFLAGRRDAEPEIEFQAKIRDRVLLPGKKSENPWRRSGEYFCVKFVIRHFLTWHLGEIKGIVAYKALMLHVLSTILREQWSSEDSETHLQLIAKVARRIRKLDALVDEKRDSLSDAEILETEGTIRETAKVVSDARDEMDKRWTAIQTQDREAKQTNFEFLTDVDEQSLEKETEIYLEDLDDFWEEVCSSNESKEVHSFTRFDQKFLTQTVKPDIRTSLPSFSTNCQSVEALNFSLLDELHRAELWMREMIMKNGRIALSMQQLFDSFQTYFSLAEPVYRDNPEFYSSMILTCFSYLVILDKRARQSYPILEEHGLGVDLEILSHLLLPLKDSLDQLEQVESYLKRRYKIDGRVSLLEDPDTENSLGARYAKHSSEMQSVKAEILKDIDDKVKSKIKEVETEYQRYRDLMEDASKRSCQTHYVTKQKLVRKCRYDPDEYESYQVLEHSEDCLKCSLEKRANAIRVNEYIRSLPNNDDSQNAVVFELRCPGEIQILRNVVHFFLTGVLKHLNCSLERIRNSSEWITSSKLSQFVRVSSSGVGLLSTSNVNDTGRSMHPRDSPEGSGFINSNLCDIYLGNGSQFFQKTLFSAGKRSGFYHLNPLFLNPLKTQCVMKTRELYKPLQWTVESRDHCDNDVICRQNECPSDLTLKEFRVFGCARAGRRLQLRNLLTALKGNALSWHQEDVLSLVKQILFETGKQCCEESELRRDQHVDLNDCKFVQSALEILESILSTIRDNWDKNLTLLCLVLFGSRLLEFAGEPEKSRAANFLFKCRGTGIMWAEKVKEKLDKQVRSSGEQLLRNKIIIITLTISMTFYTSDANIEILIPTEKDVITWLRAQNTVSDNVTLNKKTLDKSILVANLIQISWQTSLRILNRVESLIASNKSALDTFIETQYHGDIFNGKVKIPWQRVGSSRPWMAKVLDEGTQIAVNLASGTFLVNNVPVQRLPFSITSHESFERLFGAATFTVTGGGNKMSFLTTALISKSTYQFQILDSGRLLITKRNKSGSFIYISVDLMSGMLPEELANHSHWLRKPDEDGSLPREIWFHKVSIVEEPDTFSSKFYMERFPPEPNWTIIDRQNSSKMLSLKSVTFEKLYFGIFDRLELQQHLHIFTDFARKVISVALPRYRLSFFIRIGTATIESLEFPGFHIAQNQHLGTLTGLISGVVIESESIQKLIFPHSELVEELSENHVSVSVNFDELFSPPFFVFILDKNLKKLAPPSSLTANFYLALLHIKTSFILPDQLTKLTGFEMGLMILRSGRVLTRKPLSERDELILQTLESCCPQRVQVTKKNLLAEVENYPQVPRYSLCTMESLWKCCEHIRTLSTSLEFMFPNLVDGNREAEKRSSFLDMRALYQVQPSVNHINTDNCGLVSVDFQTLLTKPTLEVNPTLNGTRIVASVSDRKDAANYGNEVCSLVDWVSSQKNIYGVGYSKVVVNRELKVWITLRPREECLLDLYELAMQDDEDKPLFLSAVLTFMVHDSKLKVEETMPFNVIAQNQNLFQDLQPPEYTSYKNLPKETVSKQELCTILHEYKSCLISENSYVDSKVDRDSFRKFDERDKLYFDDKGYENAIQQAKIQYHNTRYKETESVLEQTLSQWPAECCEKISGNFELVDNRSFQCGSSELFSERYRNKMLLQFLRQVDDRIKSCLKEGGGTLEVPPFEPKAKATVKTGYVPPLRGNFIEVKLENVEDFEALTAPFVTERKTSSTFDGLEVFANTSDLDEDAISRNFYERLQQSVEVLKNSQPPPKLSEMPTSEELQRQFLLSEQKVQEIEMVLNDVLIPKDDSSVRHALYKSGIFLRASPLTILPCLLDGTKVMGNDWGQLVGALVVSWTEKQRLERCIQHKRNGKTVHLKREWSNLGHTNWVPSENVEWLILELENNFMIRPIQVQIAHQMLEPPEGFRNAVMQLNMGEGKSSVIVPMLIATIARKQSFCPQVIVLDSLYPTNCTSLNCKMGGLLDLKLIQLPFSRDLKLQSDELGKLSDLFSDCKRSKAFVVSTPEHLMSLHLKSFETFIDGSADDVKKFKLFTSLHEQKTRSILDESDDILSVKRQLVYTMGSQIALDGGPQRWVVLQSLFKCIKTNAKKFSEMMGTEHLLFVENCDSKKHEFSLFRLLTKDESCFYEMSKVILEDFLECRTNANLKPLTSVQKQNAIEFVISEELSDDTRRNLESSLGYEIPHVLYLLRAFLGLKILQHCLTLRHRVNYGMGKHRKMAVPLRAKDVAADKTDFGHPDVALALTQLSYYYQGISEKALEDVLIKLAELDISVSEKVYDSWVAECDSDSVPESLKKFSGVNLSDRIQLISLHELFSKHILVVDYWLVNFVYPQEARQFPKKLSASGWDLCREGTNRVTGFSGTNETQLLLPLTIKQCDLPELQGTNALVMQNMLKPENQVYHALAHGATADDVLDVIVSRANEIKVILDPGALILNNNKVFIQKWLSKTSEEFASVGLYFDDKDNMLVIDRKGFQTPYHLSSFLDKLDSCLVYMDDVHTRGTDLQFPSGTKAAVTLGKGLTKDKLAQACMRMRLLGCGHSLSFFASSEVDNEIKKLNTSQSKVHGVIKWVLNNSITQVRDGLIHWANQGTAQLRKLEVLKSCSGYVDSIDHLRQIGRQVVVKEVIELEKMYGESRRKESLAELISNRIKNIEQEPELKVALVKACKDYAPNRQVFADVFDEEQERELEHEAEEEVQEMRPASLSPAEPELPPCVKEAVRKGIVDVNNFITLDVCLENTKVFRRMRNKFTAVLASPEFPNVTIHSRSDSQSGELSFPTGLSRPLDKYLREPQWVLQLNQTRTLILLTPYEVNALFDQFRQMKHAVLFLFQPYYQQPNPNIPALHSMSGLSIPSGNTLEFGTDSSRHFSELNVFAGNLYVENLNQEKWICQFLGILPLPRTAEQNEAFENNLIDCNGFVLPGDRVKVPGTDNWDCPFEQNPVDTVVGMFFLRNVETLYPLSHMHRLLSRCHSNFL